MPINLKPKIFDVDLFGAALIIGICAVTYLAVILPFNGKLEQQKIQQLNNIKKQEDSERKLAHLQNLARQRQKLAAQLSHTRDVLQDNTGLAELIRQLGIITANLDLILEETLPGETNTYEHFHRTEMQVRIQGNFPKIFELLTIIKADLPFIRIANIGLSGNDGLAAAMDSTSAVCDVLMNLDVFSPK